MLVDPKKTKDEIVRWIGNYFAENGPECCAVVGISGGKDSAVVAALCVEALGKKRVLGVTMPDGVQTDIADSIEVIDHLGINNIHANIHLVLDAIHTSINHAYLSENTTVNIHMQQQAYINLPARIRMSMLYAIAQSIPSGGRVANTCNLSEDYVGYSTKFGDAAGDFSPLANLLVSEVRQIGCELGLPRRLVYKTPSDGLCGVTDEENLGFTYDELDQYIQTGHCDSLKIKEEIDRLHNRNLHKLLPMPAYELPIARK